MGGIQPERLPSRAGRSTFEKMYGEFSRHLSSRGKKLKGRVCGTSGRKEVKKVMDWSKLRLMPKTEDFFGMFEESSRNVCKGVAQLKELLHNYTNVEEKVKQIGDTEHYGDKLTHQTMKKLNKTFVTELDREDIHSLVSTLDDILDLLDATVRRMVLYKIDRPTEELIKLADILDKAVDEITKAMPLMRHLSKPEAILKHCIEINSLENDGDTVQRAAVAKLFEDAKDPIYVIKWKEIYETLETAIDRCEDVANILEGIVLKYS